MLTLFRRARRRRGWGGGAEAAEGAFVFADPAWTFNNVLESGDADGFLVGPDGDGRFAIDDAASAHDPDTLAIAISGGRAVVTH